MKRIPKATQRARELRLLGSGSEAAGGLPVTPPHDGVIGESRE